MEPEEKKSALDLFATAGMAAVLVGAGLWNLIAISMVGRTVDLAASIGKTALPLFSRMVIQATETPILQTSSAILLLVGFWVLFTTPDRLRGIVYSVIVAMLMLVVAFLAQQGGMIVWLQLGPVVN